MLTNWAYLDDGSIMARNSEAERCIRISLAAGGYLVEDVAPDGGCLVLIEGLCRAEALLLAMTVVQVPQQVRHAA